MPESRKWGKAREWVKQHLIDHPEGATIEEMMLALDLSANSVYTQLRRRKARGQVHIASWRLVPGGYGGGKYERVWRWGEGKDAPRPVTRRKPRKKK
jgi:hypothetical protein